MCRRRARAAAAAQVEAGRGEVHLRPLLGWRRAVLSVAMAAARRDEPRPRIRSMPGLAPADVAVVCSLSSASSRSSAALARLAGFGLSLFVSFVLVGARRARAAPPLRFRIFVFLDDICGVPWMSCGGLYVGAPMMECGVPRRRRAPTLPAPRLRRSVGLASASKGARRGRTGRPPSRRPIRAFGRGGGVRGGTG